jgi:cytochrome c oxidase cbb3-type subunit 3
MKLIPAYVRVIFFIILGAMEYFIDSGDRAAFLKYPMVSVFLLVFLFLLIAIEITIKGLIHQLLTDGTESEMAEVSLVSR